MKKKLIGGTVCLLLLLATGLVIVYASRGSSGTANASGPALDQDTNVPSATLLARSDEYDGVDLFRKCDGTTAVYFTAVGQSSHVTSSSPALAVSSSACNGRPKAPKGKAIAQAKLSYGATLYRVCDDTTAVYFTAVGGNDVSSSPTVQQNSPVCSS